MEKMKDSGENEISNWNKYFILQDSIFRNEMKFVERIIYFQLCM